MPRTSCSFPMTLALGRGVALCAAPKALSYAYVVVIIDHDHPAGPV
jgi:hypothetical protein